MLLPLVALWATHVDDLDFPMTRGDEMIMLTAVKAHPADYYFFHAFEAGAYKIYRPMALLFMRASHLLFGYEARGYYLSVLVFASIVVMLFWRLAEQMSGSVVAATAAAVFVAVNSQNDYCFCMVADGHNNPPSAAMFLGALLAFLRFQTTGGKWMLALSGLLAWGAVGSWEPGAAVFPALLVMAVLGRQLRRPWYGVALAAGVFTIYVVMRAHALGELVQEYAPETRGYGSAHLVDVQMSKLDPMTRIGLYAYTVFANMAGTVVPGLFDGSGAFRLDLFTKSPAQLSSPSHGTWLYQQGQWVWQAAVLLLLVWGLRRKDWRGHALGLLVMVFTACASFVLYRQRNHLIGTLGYGLILATALARLLQERSRGGRVAASLLIAALCISCALYVKAVGAQHAELRQALQENNTLTTPPEGQYPIDPEIRKELHRRYPPRAPAESS